MVMLAQEIRIRGEPTADPQKCRFVLEAEVLSRSPVSFDRESDTSKAPLAEKLLALPYIAGVSISGSAVTPVSYTHLTLPTKRIV